jgi:hypothetical protein
MVMRVVKALAVAGLLVGSARAQSLIPINTEAVKRAVVFLYSADAAGQPDTSKELATGFLLEIPKRSDPKTSYFALVTARHVVDPVWACAAPQNPVAIYARVNRKTYDPVKDTSGVEFIKVPLIVGGQTTWTKHKSETVDAVLVAVNYDKFSLNDVATVLVSDFPTPDELRVVGIGEEIVSAGLVPGLSGKNRNYPFFKFGTRQKNSWVSAGSGSLPSE